MITKLLRWIIVAAALIIAANVVVAQQIDISGFGRNYTGVLPENGDFSILQNTLNLNFEGRGSKTAFKANPLLYTYGTDSLEFRMRELYLDLYFRKFDLRIGRQQVVWGKADGVFITDIVSPLNLTEFLLPDFDEIRQGVNAAKVNYYLGNKTFEFIWIPQFTPVQKPQPGSIWFVQPDFPAPPTFDYSREAIKPGIANSEVFAKFSALTSKIDWELMAGYTWDDAPALHVQRNFDTLTMPPALTGLTITPEHHRLTVAGGSFGTQIKGVVLRSEAAYYNGKYFQTNDLQAPDGLIEKNYLHYLVGLDFVISGVTFSTQFIQQAVIDYEQQMVQDEFENTMTLLASYNTLREKLHLELFTYIGLNNSDALIRPKVTYDFDDSFSVLLGANIFAGSRDGQFGQYKDNSMIYTKIKYNF
jgi:hypothetical protein